MSAVDDILELIAINGSRWYGSEQVTQAAHALQTARLAELEGAEPPLVAAALLHDIGHLLAKERPAPSEIRQRDDHHEDIAGGYLERIFGPEVAEPVRLHVDAKRWLCATDPGYHGTLSPASVRSLELQGGAFAPLEAEGFKLRLYAEDAIRLRRWDDSAKDPAVQTRPLFDYAELLRRLARR
jgi:phosphonate degradation associated HDIG domain protein